MIHQGKRSIQIAALAVLHMTGALPANASDRKPDYHATAIEPFNGTIIARQSVWRCTDGECIAKKSGSSARHVCVRLVREVGKLEKFSFRETSFDADKLAQCNNEAR